MEKMKLEKNLTIEDFRLWSLKALKIFLVIKKNPATGSCDTQLLFFLVHFDVPLGNLQLAFCFTIWSAGKHNGLERYDNNVNDECLSEPLRPFSNKPALF